MTQFTVADIVIVLGFLSIILIFANWISGVKSLLVNTVAVLLAIAAFLLSLTVL